MKIVKILMFADHLANPAGRVTMFCFPVLVLFLWFLFLSNFLQKPVSCHGLALKHEQKVILIVSWGAVSFSDAQLLCEVIDLPGYWFEIENWPWYWLHPSSRTCTSGVQSVPAWTVHCSECASPEFTNDGWTCMSLTERSVRKSSCVGCHFKWSVSDSQTWKRNATQVQNDHNVRHLWSAHSVCRVFWTHWEAKNAKTKRIGSGVMVPLLWTP